MRRIALGIVVSIVALGLGGCARSFTDTEVRADGTWKRTVKLSLTKGMSEDKKIGDVFKLPAGANVASTESEETATWTSEHAAAASVGDIVALHKGKTLLDNEVTVREIAPGRIEYREVIRWKGPREEMDRDMAIDRAKLPALLRDRASEDQLKKIALKVATGVWRLLFGPSEPLLAQMMAQPEFLERKLRQRLGSAIMQALAEELGNKLSPDERRQIVRELLSEETVKQTFDPEREAKRDDPAPDLVSMTCVVRLPGKILESNGEIDPYTGEVFWSMYSMAAAIGDVELRAVCEVER